MSIYDTITENLPEVINPTQKKLSFKVKLKWTLIILVLFFVLGLIPLYGLGKNEILQFESLSIILGAKFGSIVSLGIGPIVTASIVLQLLNGSGIWKFDLTSHEGKKRFQGTQKLLSFFFILLEGSIYVLMGGLSPAQGFSPAILIFQLFLGGVMIMFMDEVVTKYGFGSGISLFIAAGVSQEIFIKALSPLSSPTSPGVAIGAIPQLFQSLNAGNPTTAALMLATIISTVVVFAIAVYAQAMKVEIPLSFGRVRGHGIRWPLSFIYTSNIPVILMAALLANVQLFARLVFHASQSSLAWLNGYHIVALIIQGGLTGTVILQSLAYMALMIGGSIIFSIFWVQSAGMDARTQAHQMISSGLQIPGFRRDERVLERLLQRYIGPLTIMGAITVGFLAAIADLTGALSRGTGILLSVMIIYRLYEDIAKQHMMDMNPLMRKFMGGA